MDTPQLHPIKRSTWLASIGYVRLAPEFREKLPEYDGILFLRTKRGDTYGYFVEAGIYGLMLSGKSRGKAYSRIVRGRYPTIKLPVEDG